jgi:hypothetical protein
VLAQGAILGTLAASREVGLEADMRSDQHLLLKRTAQALRHRTAGLLAPEDRHGLLHTPRGELEVSVSPALVNRALAILEQFITMIESPRVSGRVAVDARGHSFVELDGESFRFKLKQRLRMEQLVTAAEERRRLEANLPRTEPAVAWSTTDILALEFYATAHASAPCLMAKDSPRAKIERKLEVLPARLRAVIARKRKREAERAREREQLAEAAMVREQAKQRERDFLAAAEALLAESRRWHDATRLAAFLVEAQRRLDAAGALAESPGRQRLLLAQKVLKHLDPFGSAEWSAQGPKPEV